jgi:hypothetical protein
MLRPRSVTKAISESSDNVLCRYINTLENYLKEYTEIDYKMQQQSAVNQNKVIAEQRDLIEILTNLLEPKEVDISSNMAVVGKTYKYKETGAVKWCICSILAVYEDKVWIKNHETGSSPVGYLRKFEFKNI